MRWKITGQCVRWGTAAALAAVVAVPARAQNPFLGMSPENLIDAWKSAEPPQRPLIADALLDSRAAALPVLRTAAATGDLQTRRLACAMLGHLRDHGALPALLAATADPDEEVQASAVSALRALGEGAALPRLRQLARTTTKRAVLKRALVALGKFGTPADIALLRPFLSDADETVRVIAAGALAMHGNIEGQDFLLEALQSSDPLAQKNATFALGYLGTPEAQQAITRILADPNGHWKSYALMAQTVQQRRTQTPPQAVASLEGLVRGHDQVAATWALDELTDMTDPGAAQALRRLSVPPGRFAAAAQIRIKIQEGR
jgi:hypothetical protein